MSKHTKGPWLLQGFTVTDENSTVKIDYIQDLIAKAKGNV